MLESYLFLLIIASRGKDGDGQWIPKRMEHAKHFGSGTGAKKRVSLLDKAEGCQEQG